VSELRAKEKSHFSNRLWIRNWSKALPTLWLSSILETNGMSAPSPQKSCAILSTMEQQELIEKIKRLPQDRVAEVESFVDSLARRENSSNPENLHQALTDYATQHAGTDADLDPELEAAAIDHLLQQTIEQ
jgi:hypothetical protein